MFLIPNFDTTQFFAPFFTGCDNTINQITCVGSHIDV